MEALTILGGGPAGLSCGIRLLEGGCRVILHERGRYPLKKVCGEFVSPRAWARLQSLGAGPFLPEPQLLRRACFYQDALRCVDFSLDPSAYGLSRAALDTGLARRFRQLGGDLREGSEWSGSAEGAGVIDARGRPPEAGAGRSFAWKAYLPAQAAAQALEGADLVMLPLNLGYAGLSRIEDGQVSVCLIARAPVPLTALLESHPKLAALAGKLQPYASVAGFELRAYAGPSRLGDRARVWPPVVGDGISRALAAGEAEAAARLTGRGRGHRGAPAFALALGLHHLMLHPRGRSLAGAVLRRWPGLASDLYRFSRTF